jgi:hypothetical protein
VGASGSALRTFAAELSQAIAGDLGRQRRD